MHAKRSYRPARAVVNATRRRTATVAAFDPALPEDGALILAQVLRGQFNGLKAMIDAIASISGAQVDATNTLPPGSLATATAVVVSGILRLTFGIPQGVQGEQGIQGPEGQTGPPGEVTYAALNSAIETALQLTSNNSNGVGHLGMIADGSYQQWQMQALIDKLDELINALRRSGPGP